MLIKKYIKGNLNSRCHLNSFKHKKNNNSDIYVGFVVNYIKDYIVATPHFFNVLNDCIIDTTFGTNNDNIYFGKIVLNKYKSANNMFDVELWSTLYQEPKVDKMEQLLTLCQKYNLNQLNGAIIDN